MDTPNPKPNHIMFSLQQNGDLVDHDHPYLISFQQEDHTPDLHEHVSIVDDKGKSSIYYPTSSTRKRGGNPTSNMAGSGGGGGSGGSGGGGPGGDGANDKIQKKMIHREIERQRRQEMTKLYASLRDLLPLEFIKGNRSISDHMNQAVHYIRQMEENIKGLSTKRDELKKLSVSNTNLQPSNNIPNTFSVNFCNGGFEIQINSCLIEDGFMLSGVLKSLMEEGLVITSCTLTKVNDRLFHCIQTEASDPTLIDPSMLQEQLALVANAMQI